VVSVVVVMKVHTVVLTHYMVSACSILAKMNLTGANYMDDLLKDVPIESIPKALGGKFELYNESYAFDTSPTGPFHAEVKARLVRVGSANNLTSPCAAAALPANGLTTAGGAPADGVPTTSFLTVVPPLCSPSPSPTHTTRADNSPEDERPLQSIPAVDDVAEVDHLHDKYTQLQRPATDQQSECATQRRPSLDAPLKQHSLAVSGAALSSTVQTDIGSSGAQLRLTREALAHHSAARRGHKAPLHRYDSEFSVHVEPFRVPQPLTTTKVDGKNGHFSPYTLSGLLMKPAYIAAGILLCLLFVCDPWATVKYLINPILFGLFLTYVV
jgi:hypothetical protein